MRKSKFTVAVICAAVMVFAGCGGGPQAGSSAAAGSSTPPSTSPSTSSSMSSSTSAAAGSSSASRSAYSEGYIDGDPNSMFQDGAGAYIPFCADGFYGVWVAATKDEEEGLKAATALDDIGYNSYMAYAPEWENLTDEPYYCVTAGASTTEKEAQSILSQIKDKGYKDAYVKFSGKHKYYTMAYVNYGDANITVSDNKVVIRDVGAKETKTWYTGYVEEENAYRMTLEIDDKTEFDKTCDLQFFGNYQAGDTPLTWFKRNYELSKKNPDKYMENGPALVGVFEVGISGNHIEKFFGSYWWD